MEARIRMTTEMMPAHIAHVDTDGYYTYSNQRLPLIMPARPAEITGMHIREALGESAFAKIRPHLEKACRGKASVFEFTDEESQKRIRTAFTPDLRDGEIRGIYILSMDITEETQARAALMQTRKRELAAQLTSGLAHDFANLLTIILGMQSRLARMDLPDDATALIDATRRAAQRGGALLDRIAAISGPRKIRPEPVVIADFLEELRTITSPTLPENVTLEIADLGPARPVLLDPGTLQDSLLNLILNALAGGQITLANRSAGGAKVTLRLPLRHTAEKARSKMILLVEDSPDLRQSLREMLTAMAATQCLTGCARWATPPPPA